MLAGHDNDKSTARRLLDDSEPTVRGAAIGALHRIGGLDSATIRRLLEDPDAAVRARAVDVAIEHPALDLVPLLLDHDNRVVAAAAFALGERDDDPTTVPALRVVAAEHTDELCKESAVAALSALAAHPDAEHESIITTLLAALEERPPIRRRAIIGLHQFDQERAAAAVRAALEDRDRQTRALAGELLGQPVD